ncbi:LysR family transcriptional regulator [Marinomonas ostreistagni]|uniref:LysR family transcriptional regulator n=1 Tax=Marinomonas ostreistagni TaxID=359209 RepID=A0ABS0ZF04_9GAMM|nr:LysR family transcriptional regulator [Marinomonas ostreistagni]MBJ7552249.1 LysR family transcriptional regulator [Marinomonas ostreistagni]
MQNLEHIRMLVLSADLGSFSACARKLGKVQSAVSHGINALEIDLNVTLFDRSTRKPTLTPAGERLYRSAKALLAQSDEFEQIAHAVNRQEEGLIRLAIDDALVTPEVLELLEQFSRQYPHTQLELFALPTPDIIQHIQTREADLGLMFSEIKTFKEVDFGYIGQIKMLPVCHVESPLAAQKQVTETALYPYRQVAIRGGKKIEPSMLVSMTPNVWWCSSTQIALDLILSKIGWGYLPYHLVKEALKDKRLVKVDVEFDQKIWEAPIDLVWQRGSSKGPALTWLLQQFKAAFAKAND